MIILDFILSHIIISFDCYYKLSLRQEHISKKCQFQIKSIYVFVK